MKQLVRNIETLKTNTEKNNLKKEYMGLQLIENINTAKKIREEIPKKIKNREKRDFLELEIKNHVLELQNIELEINLQIQEKTINDLKSIIDNQRRNVGDQGSIQSDNELEENEYEELLEDLHLEDEQEQEIDDEEDEYLENFKEIIEKQKQQKQQTSPKLRDKSAPVKKQRQNPKAGQQ